MKTYLLILIATFTIATLHAQTLSKETIKHSSEYYWGESSSENEKEAEDAALARLTKQIAVTVSSSFERTLLESSESLQESVQNIIKTYSTATLKNVQSIRKSVGGNIEVFLYIHKSEVQQIFDERKRLIFNIYRNALDFEKENNISSALKSYYFALVLINSIPEQSITVNDINLTTEIPIRINSIIANVKFMMIEDTKIDNQEREVRCKVYAFEKPVTQMDFSFWDGLNQVNVQVLDGEAIFTLLGGSTKFDKLDVSIKYSYYESRNEISTVNELWNLVNRPSFRNSKQVLLKTIEAEQLDTAQVAGNTNNMWKKNSRTVILSKQLPTVSLKRSRNYKLVNPDSCKFLEKITDETDKLLQVINSGNSSLAAVQYQYDSFLKEKISNIIKFNKIKAAYGDVEAEVNKTYDGWELRKIQVLNKYSSLNKQSQEYLVPDFDEAGNLYDINFGIMDNLYGQFVEQGLYGDDWGNRQVIIKFVEKYRTAFLSRNIDMLDSMFSDEAVIIVGRVMKKTQMKEVYKYIKMNEEQPDVQYMQYTKNEYLKNQANLFKNQKDLYVGYNSFKISRKNKQDSIYGLSMRQNYQATNYADEGYLFLLVDFNQDQPQIYVRSWQPQEWSEGALIKLSNFNVNK